MHTFSCYITDDRYSIPTLAFMLVGDVILARDLALRRLMESPHHRSIELLDGDERVFVRSRTRSQNERPAFR
jgi:hypothetical protein